MKFGRYDAEPRQYDNHKVAVEHDVSMRRLRRRADRCRCGHGRGVHVDGQCQMDCECSGYRKQ